MSAQRSVSKWGVQGEAVWLSWPDLGDRGKGCRCSVPIHGGSASRGCNAACKVVVITCRRSDGGISASARARHARCLVDDRSDDRTRDEFRISIVRQLDARDEAFHLGPGEELYLPPDQRVRIW